MSSRRLRVEAEGQAFGQMAFSEGVSAVLAVVFGNDNLLPQGISSGVGRITDDDLEAIRWLRQKVHGKKAVDYKPNRKRPERNAIRGLRHGAGRTDAR